MANDKCLPMIWGWSVPCLPYDLCLVDPALSRALPWPLHAPLNSLLSSLSTGVSWCPTRTPAPTWQSTSWSLPVEGLVDAVPTPGVHTWSVSLRVCSHLLLAVHQ